MKRLYLMRHGHSPTAQEAGVKTDAQRPLSPKGRRDAEKVARELVRRGGRPALVLHSPLRRAVETAAAAAKALGLKAEELAALDNTLPAEEALAALRGASRDADEALAVGHQPQVGEILAYAVSAAFEFRPAGVVALELEPSPRLLWAFNADEVE